jgi:hypothetical protein
MPNRLPCLDMLEAKPALAVAVRRFETPPGKQAQVDWGASRIPFGRRHGAPALGVYNHARLQHRILAIPDYNDTRILSIVTLKGTSS